MCTGRTVGADAQRILATFRSCDGQNKSATEDIDLTQLVFGYKGRYWCNIYSEAQKSPIVIMLFDVLRHIAEGILALPAFILLSK